ncbi:MAG: tRNA (adenosine(37)-N6)-threonylcarbamoyltransferase complex transferase subunit TsaD [Chloroflexi bacterium]|nr:tRNA (adenosine(37)-N6)-threonylcarbamoyltransferase complex transferase subunit TsaD [Chloroflexota bacterium]
MTVILGIETSCDETAAAVVVDGRVMRSNVVSSQVELHAPYGGIFPEVASRAHIEHIYPVVQKALDDAAVTATDLDAIAATRGPGLAGSLTVGANMAKGLALAYNKPLVAVNHLEGHVYSLWLAGPEFYFMSGAADQPDQTPPIAFPVVVLIVSGGHTELLLMHDHGDYQRLGGTLDDAAGEAFDKVGRLLGLPYPGGPAVQRAAQSADPAAFDFPRVWLRGDQGERNFNFSFSGIKTAMLHTLQELIPGYQPDSPLPEDAPIADLAASFQQAVVDVLVAKTVRAAQDFDATEILVAGGVSANQLLRQQMVQQAERPVRVPPLPLCTDNAAMIAAAGHYRFMAGQRDDLNFDVVATWPLATPAA